MLHADGLPFQRVLCLAFSATLQLSALVPPANVLGDEPNTSKAPRIKAVAQAAERSDASGQTPIESIAELARRIQRSVVLLKTSTRNGSDHGIGAGFVIDHGGLVVTARHVIGDGREITVELPGNRTSKVTEVFASSGRLDLAVVRIEDHTIPPLEIGTADLIVDGLEIVALGHPRGFRNSVVDGLISGQREIDGISMLQLAMPVEPGNSGGPVVDRRGRVVGVVTMKSTASDNLGFAIPVNILSELIADPNPVPMSRWRTIGSLDSQLWNTLFGANWRQHAGRISVDGTGSSFGGRSLCIRKQAPELESYEWQATVKLQDESGAAGLIFHSDEADRHYGFYPSAGNIRLTRFDGPDVNSWTILHNEPHPAYRSNDWNTLKVRIEADGFTCYLNDQEVLVSNDDAIPIGKVGLASFRGTEADFRNIVLADRIPPVRPDQETEAELRKIIQTVTSDVPANDQTIEELLKHPLYSSEFLENEARRLLRLADRMRDIRQELNQVQVLAELSQILTTGVHESETGVHESEGKSLLRAALLIAKLDNDEVDVNAYIARVDQMGEEILGSLPAAATGLQRLHAIDEYLFQSYGFRGSRFEYYSPSNSYLNEVIDDREGLPITLSILYIALADRLTVNVAGVGMPGHFIVRYEPRDSSEDTILIDPFEKGLRLTKEEALKRLTDAGYPANESFLQSQTTHLIVERMLRNLLNLAEQNRSDVEVLRYLEALVTVMPDNSEYRAKRLEIRARTGRLEKALEDADWFMKNRPEGTNHDRLMELHRLLNEKLQTRNAAR